MSRPRFIADHDVSESIVEGLLAKEPTFDLVRARDVGLGRVPDRDILTYAAQENRIVLSHDQSTMIDAAARRPTNAGIIHCSSAHANWARDRRTLVDLGCQ